MNDLHPMNRVISQEERELGGSLSRQPEQQATNDGRAGTRGPWDHRQALGQADLERVFPGDVIHGFSVHFMLAALGP